MAILAWGGTAVGIGLGCLLLQVLSTIGLLVLLIRLFIAPGKLKHPKYYLVGIGLVQAWPMSYWMAHSGGDVQGADLIWLSSMALLAISLAAGVCWRVQLLTHPTNDKHRAQ